MAILYSAWYPNLNLKIEKFDPEEQIHAPLFTAR